VVSLLITAFLYLFSSVIIFGLLPFSELQKSTAPFADATGLFLGGNARNVVAVIALVVTFGALNGWMLIQGLIPYAMFKDGLFPKAFGKVNRNNAPYLGILISSVLATLVLLLRYSDSLIQVFSFMMNLSTLSVLTPYLFSIFSLYVVLTKSATLSLKMKLLMLFSGAFCIWMIFGVGWEVFLYGIGLILIGVILYTLNIKRNR
jgi:APA family basic amino acid/polyamine antiporter